MLFRKRKYPDSPPASFLTKSDYRRRSRELIIIVVVIFVVAALMYFESRIMDMGLDLPFSDTVMLYIMSFITLLLVVLLIFLIFRNIIKLVYDRRRKVLGSRLRTRLVVSFVTLSLLPTIVLFIFSVNFINISIKHWANAPVETAMEKADEIAQNYYTFIQDQNLFFLKNADIEIRQKGYLQNSNAVAFSRYIQTIQRAFHFDALEYYDLNDRVHFSISDRLLNEYFGKENVPELLTAFETESSLTIISSRRGSSKIDLIKVAIPIPYGKKPGEIEGFLIGSTVLGPEVVGNIMAISDGVAEYESFLERKVPFQKQYIIALTIVAFVVLFCAIWVGFYLAKTISIPIRELAEGTRRVAQGNLDVTISKVGDDEIGSLVNDFNQMIHDLRINRFQLELSTSQMRQQNRELEQRRQYIEIVLESVSAGVVTLDALGYIVTINKSAEKILGIREEEALDLAFTDVIGADRYRLSKESLEQIRPLHAAQSLTLRLFINDQARSLLMTSSPLLDQAGNHIGAVIVFDDLTELEKGERMAAWREVARRVAHEVKNPLTPISLSAERLSRKYGKEIDDPVFDECTKVIIDHVELIRNIVNEFSSFARFPSSILKPAELLPIIEESLALYRETNHDIVFTLNVNNDIPSLHIDVLRLKQVFINLLDNAIAAMHGHGSIDITVRLNRICDHVQIMIADDGPGLSDLNKTRIFEPNFSTKATGMGLGLTIVSTIIADHKGTIHVTDNLSGGATFVIQLPVN